MPSDRGSAELFAHYHHTLDAMGKQKGLLGLILTKSQNKFWDPARSGFRSSAALRGLGIGFS
jgi:hypothetical protein